MSTNNKQNDIYWCDILYLIYFALCTVCRP